MSELRVVILYNPISGRGQGLRIAKTVTETFRNLNIETLTINSRNLEALDWKRYNRAVVVGGDGTLQELLSLLTLYQIPVCLYPCGNQSLFAKQFSYSRNINKFCEMVIDAQIEEHHLGVVNGKLFFFMVSVGFDGFIVGEVSKRRGRDISNLSYLYQILNNLISYRAPVLSVEIDGQPFIEDKRGAVIIANSNQYALGLKVANNADSKMNNFIIRFIPSFSALGFMMKLLCSNFRRYQWTVGENIKLIIKEEKRILIQLDGETLPGEKVEVMPSSAKLLVVAGK